MNFLQRSNYKKRRSKVFSKIVLSLAVLTFVIGALRLLDPHFRKIYEDFKTKMYHLQQSYVDGSSLTAEIDRLKRQNLILHNEMVQQQLKLSKIENIKLLNAYNFDDKKMTLLKLSLIDYRGDKQRLFFDITDKTEASIGDGVINESGLIGTVESINDHRILVKMLTDIDSNFAIVDKRTGQHYIAQGLGYNNMIELLYVSENEDVKEGDVILSSGMGNHLPHGLRIGEISNVDIPPGSSFFTVKIKVDAMPGYGEYYSLLH